METLLIQIQDPKARRLIDDLADLGLITIKTSDSTWSERWQKFSSSLPAVSEISEEDIFEEISQIRKERSGS